VQELGIRATREYKRDISSVRKTRREQLATLLGCMRGAQSSHRAKKTFAWICFVVSRGGGGDVGCRSSDFLLLVKPLSAIQEEELEALEET
jgi:hypothetical protein